MNKEKIKETKNEVNLFKKYFNYHLLYDFVRITGVLPAMLLMRPKVYHVGDKKAHNIKSGVIISVNHTTFTDVILMLCVFFRKRLYSLATKDLLDNKIKKLFFSKMHCIEVDKDNFSMSAFHDAVDTLKAGKPLMMFPEGGVNHGDETEIGPFKSGMVLMAQRAKVPILPVYQTKREKWYGPRIVLIGDPVNVAEMCGVIPSMEDINAVSESIRQREIELKDYYNNTIKRNKGE